ncbi:MAG: Biopolymer transport protein ExbD/TolR [Ignavibacteriae bacterium]|nr:MAG: Biopolymer transport protein ExbD/TolR [Ignavibacteriota bacterium]
MGAVDTAAPRGAQRKKGKKRRQPRRLGIRIDMTPMVDIAFLLLTFFMLTTTMSKPQTMEINLPPSKDVKVEIAESNLMTLRVKGDGSIYWNMGIESPKKVEFKDLKALLKERIEQNPKLTVLLKIHRDGKYHMMVDIIDEFNVSGISRFSIAPLTEADLKVLAKVS